MEDKNTDLHRNQAILQALDEAIEEGPWDATVFFQAIRNKLIEIRNQFEKETGLTEENVSSASRATLFGNMAKRHGMVEVFILLYNADGNSIPKWENLLRSISSQIVSRPVYRLEADAKSALRAATNRMNEAYVSVFIQEDEILPSQLARAPHDRHGHEILSVKEGAIQCENIDQFIHSSGQYDFKNNKLIWTGVVELNN